MAETLYLTKINFVSLYTSPDKILATWLSMTQHFERLNSGFGRHTVTSGEMTFGQLDRLVTTRKLACEQALRSKKLGNLVDFPRLPFTKGSDRHSDWLQL